MDQRDDGQRFCARIVEAIEKHDQDLADKEEVRKFRVSVNDDEYDWS